MTTTAQLEPYGGGQLEQRQGALVMTPESAKALDEQVRLCTEAVLREGTDYGVIPGTSGEKTLWRPGAQKLLQWFGLECTCERIEVERDDDGRKHGITYRAEVGRGLKTAAPVILATCEGTADYDESKFFQTAGQVQRKAEDRERAWAAKDGRPARPTKWQGLPEYRADWNALMKRAQKRAIVGAVNDATAAGGIFTDREEDDNPAPQNDSPAWYEQAIEAALTFPDRDAGAKLYTEAAQAHRDGLCSRRQQDHIQNRIKQRVELLKTATPVDVEDLGRQEPAAQDDTQASPGRALADDEDRQDRTQGDPRAAGAASPRGAQPPAPQAEDEPGSVTEAQLTKLHTVLTGLGFSGDDREQKLVIAETVIGRVPLHGPAAGRSSKNLSLNEARSLIDTLDGFDGRDALIAYMAGREQGGGGDE